MGFLNELHELVLFVLHQAKLGKVELQGLPVENPQNHAFPALDGNCGNPKIHRPPVHHHLDAPVLGHPGFRNVQVRQNLHPGDDGGSQVGRRRVDFVQDSVHPHADAEISLIGFKMDIGGLVAHRPGQNAFKKPDDGSRLRSFGFFRSCRLGGLLGIGLFHGLAKGLGLGHDGLGGFPRQSFKVGQEGENVGVGNRHPKLAVHDIDGEGPECPGRSRVDHGEGLGLGLELVPGNPIQTLLAGQSAGKVFLRDMPPLQEKRPQPAARAALFRQGRLQLALAQDSHLDENFTQGLGRGGGRQSGVRKRVCRPGEQPGRKESGRRTGRIRGK